jgi:hypothetical protein
MSAPSIIEQRIEWTRGFRTATDKTVLKALARWWAYRADGSHVQPSSVEDLAAKSGVAKRSTERALQRLLDGRWIAVTDYGNRQPTTYQIMLDRLATSDPEALHSAATVADETVFDRQSGGRSGGRTCENAPDFDKVADELSLTRSMYVQRSGTTTGYTHTHTSTATMADEPAADLAPYRHPNHDYCGTRFCLPTFLGDEFRQQAHWSPAQLEHWCRAENARAERETLKIGNALKFLRGRFEAAITATAPQQLGFGLVVPSERPPARARPQVRDIYDEAEAYQRQRGSR